MSQEHRQDKGPLSGAQARGQGRLGVAGEVGDGVILNWLAPEDVPRCVRVVRDAARKAGRDPDAIEVACRICVYLDEDDLVARATSRRT